jgi:nucleoside-diphosphate-sugar epimerase
MPGRLLIAGANGWLGRAVRAEGARRGWTVVGVGRKPSAQVDLIATSDAEMVNAIVAGAPSVVVNCTGSAAGDVAAMRRTNVDLVQTLLEASERAGARLVHIGSAAEIGDPNTPAQQAEDCRLSPISDYGRTKAEGSTAVIECNGDAVVARLFNVAGPNPPSSSFLASLVDKVRTEGEEVMLGNTEMVRDWISIDFAVEAIFALASSSQNARLVHVCSGRGIRHGDLAAALARRLGHHRVVRSEGAPGVRAVVGNPALLRTITGLSSAMTIDDLAECVLPLAGNTDIGR